MVTPESLNPRDEAHLPGKPFALSQQSAMIVAPLSRISTLITCSDATADELAPLEQAGARIIIADAVGVDHQGAECSIRTGPISPAGMSGELAL